MTIESRDRSWFFGPIARVNLDANRRLIHNGEQVTVHTSDLLSVEREGVDFFYRRDDINQIPADKIGLGGLRRLKWRDGYLKPEGEEARERELLAHPLIGSEAYIKGQSLQNESGSQNRTGWVKVRVVAGERREIYPNVDNNPVDVEVRIVEEDFRGQVYEVSDDSLRRIASDSKTT